MIPWASQKRKTLLHFCCCCCFCCHVLYKSRTYILLCKSVRTSVNPNGLNDFYFSNTCSLAFSHVHSFTRTRKSIFETQHRTWITEWHSFTFFHLMDTFCRAVFSKIHWTLTWALAVQHRKHDMLNVENSRNCRHHSLAFSLSHPWHAHSSHIRAQARAHILVSWHDILSDISELLIHCHLSALKIHTYS